MTATPVVPAFGPTHDGRAKTAPLSHASRVVRGMKRRDLAVHFQARGYTSGCEVGVADGRYSAELLARIPGLRLRCVDPWEPYAGNRRGGGRDQQHGNYDLARARFAPYGTQATMVRALSADAARDVPAGSLDFVYLDANHDFDYVMQDLILWAPKVRAGGTVAGHDFYEFRDAGVIPAVEAYTRAHEIADWFLCDEREPSFYWVVRA